MDPVDEVKAHLTRVRRIDRWLLKYSKKLNDKAAAKYIASRHQLSPAAERLLAAMESAPSAPPPVIDAEFPEVDEDLPARPLPGYDEPPEPAHDSAAPGPLAECCDCGAQYHLGSEESASHDCDESSLQREAPERPPVEQWTEADFKRNGWVQAADGNWGPGRLVEPQQQSEDEASERVVREEMRAAGHKPRARREARRA